MASLTSVLALYSALDQAVLATRGRPEGIAVAAVVEQYLPGSTGQNAGWSNELARFISETPGIEATIPSVAEALAAFGHLEAPPPPSITGRMVYAVGALLHLPQTRPSEDIPEYLFTDALNLAAMPTVLSGETGAELLQLLYDDFSNGGSWEHVAAIALRRNLMSADVANWKPCESDLVQDDDKQVRCVRLKARYVDKTLTLQQVMNVLEPTNWPKLSEFFCSVTPSGPVGADGWLPALEVVSANCPKKPLTTALKFFKKTRPDRFALVEYDLDPNPPAGKEGDGVILVDRGSILVRSLGAEGVEVNASKIVHISTLSPVAQNIYTCVMGYNGISQDMILGGARNPPPNPDPFVPSPEPRTPDHGSPPSDGPGAPPKIPIPTPAPGPNPEKPKPPADTPVEAAVDMLVDCAKEMNDKASEVAKKWAAGTLTTSDMIAYSSYVGSRMASDPWRFLELFSSPSTRRPKRKGRTS